MTYDAIIVGAGLAGASLAKNLAERGYRVLVFEREARFKDRVRGEGMYPWGVSAARALGVYDHLASTCGKQTRWVRTWVGGELFAERDLAGTCPHGLGMFNFYHPAMQEALLELAEKSGASIRRAVAVKRVIPGNPPRVQFEDDGGSVSLEARIIVGADGRNSQVRSWGGFQVQRDPDRLIIAGLLLEGTSVPDDAGHFGVGPDGATFIAPLGGKRARAYFMYRKADGVRHLSGDQKIGQFLESLLRAGVPTAWFHGVRAAGPLAEFNGTDHWVDEPAHNGVVLIGDAAAASDPDFGAGLSLTLLDVLHLRDCLCSTPDWSEGITRYAQEHDRCYAAFHEVERCWAKLLWDVGTEADERRARVLHWVLTEPKEVPDIFGLGPDSPIDERARRLFFGEG
jgi:2-polyprenyl-6-methoxyphenol hydroxylase-like FAD-dependent oxidoreductase